MQEKKEVLEALYKKAVGYDTSESVEEYITSDSELVLNKRKVSSKHIPPDINALKLYLSINQEDYQKLTDDELEAEKLRLINLLNSCGDDG